MRLFLLYNIVTLERTRLKMKAKEVLQKLNITRPTLTKYVKEGWVKVDSKVNGQYYYNEDSVNALLNNKKEVKNNIELEQNKTNELLSCLDNIIKIFDILGCYNQLPPEALSRLNESKKLLKTIKKD